MRILAELLPALASAHPHQILADSKEHKTPLQISTSHARVEGEVRAMSGRNNDDEFEVVCNQQWCDIGAAFLVRWRRIRLVSLLTNPDVARLGIPPSVLLVQQLIQSANPGKMEAKRYKYMREYSEKRSNAGIPRSQ